MKPRFPERFTYMVLDVEDNEEQNLIRLFPGYVCFFASVSQQLNDFLDLLSFSAKQFIDQAISQGGRVLVHCNGACLSQPCYCKLLRWAI